MPKAVMGILFTLLLVIMAFLVGLVIGGKNVSTADGLAAGAIVLGYGVAGAIIALIAGILLSIKFDPKILSILSLVALLGILGTIALIVSQKNKRDMEKARQEELEAKSRFRNFRFSITFDDEEIRPAALANVKQVYVTQRGRELTTPLTDDGSKCSAILTPDESRVVLQGIYQLATQRAEHVCRTNNDGPPAARFVWHFYDKGSPASGEWYVTNACFQSST
ncbi:MAG: DUF4064 domain-containing protein, partial [Rhodothermales bacterium]|nr:DUF4064 domain-containing protein [Rhodothermales bacterium]